MDLDMLNVALGRGTLELRSALLNTDYLNAQLVRARGLGALTSMPAPTAPALQRQPQHGVHTPHLAS